MLISLRTLRLLAELGDQIALDALDDLGIDGSLSHVTYVGRMTRTAFNPWWSL